VEKALIVGEMERYVKNYHRRAMTETRWKRPLAGFASVEDPLFLQLRESVRPSHALPQDLLPAGKTIMAFFLPFENNVGKANAEEGFYSARAWAVAFVETNRLIRDLGDHLKDFLEKGGHRTITTPVTHNYDQAILVSDWSHRHVAYIAGLGQFGLHRWLITEKGCCGRLGSFITEAFFPPTPRPKHELCLNFAGYECSGCLEKCMYGALFLDNFDRHACNRQLLKNDAYFSDLETSDVCGKCGCGVPCSTGNPMAKRSLKGNLDK
jgi:epoxyqueuosine reductase QueG